MTRLLTALALSAAVAPSTALACGGLFCNQELRVDQSKESIVFVVDREEEKVKAHIQISYEGPAEDFSWVLPIPGVPELAVSSPRLFTVLDPNTTPLFQLISTYEDCLEEPWFGETDAWPEGLDSDGWDTALADSAGPAPAPGITILSTGQVGAFDQVTLQADSAEALSAWLLDNDYDLPPTYETALAGYVVPGNSFVALKLSKDSDAGDIQPLAVSWSGTAASIPLTLTGIAATPDMPIEVYVLSDDRAVPDNYLHVQINEAAVDWLGGATNYKALVTQAANEAGGQAFATDVAMAHTTLGSQWWFFTDNYDEAALAAAPDLQAFVTTMLQQGTPSDQTLLDLLTAAFPLPSNAGVTAQAFFNCPQCYPTVLTQVDYTPKTAAAAAAQIEAQLYAPLREIAADLAAQPYLTRLTSSMSAEEMTQDPIFVINEDMDDVNRVHEATMRHECGGTLDWDTAPRVLELSDGRELNYPPINDGVDSADFLNGLKLPAASLIEDLGAEGDGDVLSDKKDEGVDKPADPPVVAPDQVEDRIVGSGAITSGCGCSQTSPAPVSAFGLLLAALAVRRRRQR